ncbi:MAG: DUF4625 domain-containing protein [Flavobacteriales bacterium]|nr:DUF4625 domain-containing protein [Flavobacteriales bacterium]MCB9190576.1 DUF4625 domain-containing protein [Flavobacteriales bacterium]
MKIGTLIPLLAIVAFAACNQVTDAERPTISIDLPNENGIVTTNDGLRIVATLSDDTGLLQYKVILDGIDSENGIAADSTSSFIIVEGVPNKDKALYLDQVFPLSDTTFNGSYRIILACIDIEGNESLKDTVNFEIKNSIDNTPPVIDVGGPSSDTLTIGQGFSPFGTITDSQSLIYASIYIGKVDGSDTLHWFDFPVIQNNLVLFGPSEAWWAVDSTWAQGHYHLYCTAWDNYSGVSSSVPFHVSY